ncbi:AAA family ATPase [Caproiciproducens sp. R1]|uniref:AAA family ATPase n=1 Tax=Caproiciproducens sp. R1 TaxID=3435000 RepID=UPI004034D56F
MKNLIFINGTMGVGKTSTCKELLNLLQPGVFLDGDWCWYMNPFQVTDETKHMVENNICFLLNSFLSCSEYENVIFCWVMHQEPIIDKLLKNLNLEDVKVQKITLSISKEALTQRLKNAIERGERTSDALQGSLDRLPLYSKMNTIHIDVSDISPVQAAQKIIESIDN